MMRRGGVVLLGGFATMLGINYRQHHQDEDDDVYDVAIVGAGVVGLAVARFCAFNKMSVVCFEREDVVSAAASSGNSGIGCTGYDAPKGSLERQLLRRSIQLHPSLYRSFGLSYEHVRKCGSLVVAWTPEDMKKLPEILEENRDAGDEEACMLSKEELYEMEPALGSSALGAVYCPREAVVEPWLVPIGYFHSAKKLGANILTSTQVDSAYYNKNERLWTVCGKRCKAKQIGRSTQNELFVRATSECKSSEETTTTCRARVLINCAGLYGDHVENMILGKNSPKEFNIIPRKGQFLVFKLEKQNEQLTCVIEPTPSQFTKGVIVWRTIYGNLIVGPTAEPQISRSDRSTHKETIEMLRKHAEKVVPDLVKNATVIGTYSGLRPATEHRDYLIKKYPDNSYIRVAGIRSTGLTASSGIGEYVSELCDSLLFDKPVCHASSSMVGVTQAATSCQVPLRPMNSTTIDDDDDDDDEVVPTLIDLAKDYRHTNDGTVSVYGERFRVTHPISSFGMETIDVTDDNNNEQ